MIGSFIFFTFKTFLFNEFLPTYFINQKQQQKLLRINAEVTNSNADKIYTLTTADCFAIIKQKEQWSTFLL